MTATNDDVDDDGESVTMTFGMLPEGVRVGSPASTVVQLTDDDTAGVTLGRTELVVTEGSSATYTVALDSEPTADVSVTITGHAGTDLTLTPATAMLTFTPSTWGRTQTVTVAAGDDGDALNDSALLTHRAGGATEYASVTASLSVTVTDDDTRATGAPTITGTAEVGEELTANTSGIADADGLNNVSYVYQWVRVASGGGESDHPRRDVGRLHAGRRRCGRRLQAAGDVHRRQGQSGVADQRAHRGGDGCPGAVAVAGGDPTRVLAGTDCGFDTSAGFQRGGGRYSLAEAAGYAGRG